MVRPTTPQPPTNVSVTPKQLASGIADSVITLISLCGSKAKKQLSLVTKKLQVGTGRLIASPSPIARSKVMIASISNKMIQLKLKRKKRSGKGEDGLDGGLWRRTILMGDKCQPLDFSGVIYYDSDGKALSEIPFRSPRATPMSNHALVPAK
ncbi:uncharacterized protein LOC124932455 [Impatiens glandulifera]|uniref:uncharacterized protein LOC124932455 n=1 Tax=Impatiens glandulifera TaxID=253017 RepID=UPI001FB18074|nr:uncharacterized protein LOC124932455 [Impatiens glandulifera]